MATLTFGTTGSFETGSNWVGGIAPVATDSWIIPAGLVATLTANRTQTGGFGEVQGGGDLRGTGGVRLILSNAELRLLNNGSAAGRLSHTGAGGAFIVQIGAELNTTSFFSTNGLSKSVPCLVEGADVTNHIRFEESGNTAEGRMQCKFGKFVDCGSGTVDMAEWRPRNDLSWEHFHEDCQFLRCGRMNQVSNDLASMKVRFLRCTWQDSPGATNLRVYSFNTAKAVSGERLMDECVFDKQLDMIGGRDWTVKNIYCLGNGFANMGSNFAFALAENWWIRKTTGVDQVFLGGCDGFLLLIDGGALNNPHGIQIKATLPTGSYIWKNGAIEFTGSATNGDMFLLSSHTSANTFLEHERVIMPRNHSGNQCGTLVSGLGDADSFYRGRHLTIVSTSNGASAISMSETYAGHAGQFGLVDSIVLNPAGGSTGHKVHQSAGPPTPVQNTMQATDAHHNCGFGLDAGAELKGYDCDMSGVPGANDVDVDPQIVDSTADIRSWSTSLGGAGTVADVIAQLQKRHTPAQVDAYTLSAYLDFMRTKWAPQNALIGTAASDGTTIGAVPIGAAPPAGIQAKLVAIGEA